MVCSNCGAVNPENAAFCQRCGASFAQVSPTEVAFSQHPVVDAAKRIGASKLFLVAAILLSVTLLLTGINTLFVDHDTLGELTSLAGELGVGENLGALDPEEVKGSSAVGALIGMLPSILLTAGVWMTYAAASDRTTSGMKTSGLTMIKVIMIVELVLLCVGTVVIEVLLSVAAGALFELGDTPSSAILGALIGMLQIAWVPILALMIVYIALMISTINKVKKTVTTGVAYYKASGFVAVVNFIMAAPVVAVAFFGGALQCISSLCSAATLVLFGILIFRYRSTLRPFAEMQTMPPVSPPEQNVQM